MKPHAFVIREQPKPDVNVFVKFADILHRYNYSWYKHRKKSQWRINSVFRQYRIVPCVYTAFCLSCLHQALTPVSSVVEVLQAEDVDFLVPTQVCDTQKCWLTVLSSFKNSNSIKYFMREMQRHHRLSCSTAFPIAHVEWERKGTFVSMFAEARTVLSEILLKVVRLKLLRGMF